jgi:hypothetical protein
MMRIFGCFLSGVAALVVAMGEQRAALRSRRGRDFMGSRGENKVAKGPEDWK